MLFITGIDKHAFYVFKLDILDMSVIWSVQNFNHFTTLVKGLRWGDSGDCNSYCNSYCFHETAQANR